tara:strand:+ start:933 stop:1253 length:321 start_codon:yes stop_codon:yes gene_type:complete
MRNKFKGGAGAGCSDWDSQGNCKAFVSDHNLTHDNSITVGQTYAHNVGNYQSPVVGALNFQPSAFAQMGGGQRYIKKNKKKINTILEKLKKKYKNNKKINLKKELK